MEGLGIARRLRINVFEGQHFRQALLIAARKATLLRKSIGFFECTEKSVPDRQITKVLLVHTKFVMHGVMLRPLDK